MTTQLIGAPTFACLIPALAALGWFGACTSVEAQSFVPARLKALRNNENLQCPASPQQSSVLFCQAEVSKTGAVKDRHNTHCFGTLGYDRERADALRKEVVGAQFEPASVDGETVEVYVSFRVLFQEMNGRCDVSVVQNLGNQEDEFGAGYFGPQEIYTNGGWRAPAQLEGGDFHYRSDSSGMAFAMSVAVDAFGNASDGRVEVNNFARDESVRFAVDSLQRQRFIPAFVDGVPRAAGYVEFSYVREPRTR